MIGVDANIRIGEEDIESLASLAHVVQRLNIRITRREALAGEFSIDPVEEMLDQGFDVHQAMDLLGFTSEFFSEHDADLLSIALLGGVAVGQKDRTDRGFEPQGARDEIRRAGAMEREAHLFAVHGSEIPSLHLAVARALGLGVSSMVLTRLVGIEANCAW
jgi:hypothetical protein